jgi:hypothetical protein
MNSRPESRVVPVAVMPSLGSIERDMRASWAQFDAHLSRAKEDAALIARADKFGRAVEQWADTVPVQYSDEAPELPPITMTVWERATLWLQDHKFTAGLLTGMWVGAFMAWARFS